VVLTTGIIGSASDDAKLVFEHDGDRYVFSQAQMAGDETTLAAVRPKRSGDKHVAKATKECGYRRRITARRSWETPCWL